MRWERLCFDHPDVGGTTIAYRISPPRPRALVLVAHGAGNDALFSMVTLFKRLLEAGYEIFTFDLDGHGRESTTRFDPGAVLGAVPAAYGWSGAAARGLRVHALGVSLGGSLVLAALPRLRVASAALLVAPLRIRWSWRAVAREVGWRLARAAWRARADHGIGGIIPSFGPFRRGVYPLRLAVPPGPGAFGYVDVLNDALERADPAAAAAATDVPLWLAYGMRDLLVPVEQGERIAECARSARLLRVPRETHLTTPSAPAVLDGVVSWFAAHDRG